MASAQALFAKVYEQAQAAGAAGQAGPALIWRFPGADDNVVDGDLGEV